MRVRNPLNIGAAARAMSNFGFGILRLVNCYEVAFREARSAVGASDVLSRAEQYPSLAEAITDCTLVVGTTAVGHIPTCEEHISMNLGQAVAVCLYELVRQSKIISETKQSELARAGTLDRITAVLTETLYRRGYMTADATPATTENIRRLVRRMKLCNDDAETLLGMLRHMSRD